MKKNLLKELTSLTMSFETNQVRIWGPIDDPPAPHSLGLQIAEQNKQRLDSNQGNKGKMFFSKSLYKTQLIPKAWTLKYLMEAEYFTKQLKIKQNNITNNKS